MIQGQSTSSAKKKKAACLILGRSLSTAEKDVNRSEMVAGKGLNSREGVNRCARAIASICVPTHAMLSTVSCRGIQSLAGVKAIQANGNNGKSIAERVSLD